MEQHHVVVGGVERLEKRLEPLLSDDVPEHLGNLFYPTSFLPCGAAPRAHVGGEVHAVAKLLKGDVAVWQLPLIRSDHIRGRGRGGSGPQQALVRGKVLRVQPCLLLLDARNVGVVERIDLGTELALRHCADVLHELGVDSEDVAVAQDEGQLVDQLKAYLLEPGRGQQPRVGRAGAGAGLHAGGHLARVANAQHLDKPRGRHGRVHAFTKARLQNVLSSSLNATTWTIRPTSSGHICKVPQRNQGP
ncbi:MAG: hypothetical protein CL844_05610 [Crocinitomicaceae bacterium]|nr:hypothetical protein [Crocinitomicaceae bacterium]